MEDLPVLRTLPPNTMDSVIAKERPSIMPARASISAVTAFAGTEVRVHVSCIYFYLHVSFSVDNIVKVLCDGYIVKSISIERMDGRCLFRACGHLLLNTCQDHHFCIRLDLL